MMRLPFAFSSEQNMPAKSPVTLRMVYELVQSIDVRTSRLEVTTEGLVTTEAWWQHERPGHNDRRLGGNNERLGHNDARPGGNNERLGHNDRRLGRNNERLGRNDGRPGRNNKSLGGSHRRLGGDDKPIRAELRSFGERL